VHSAFRSVRRATKYVRTSQRRKVERQVSYCMCLQSAKQRVYTVNSLGKCHVHCASQYTHTSLISLICNARPVHAVINLLRRRASRKPIDDFQSVYVFSVYPQACTYLFHISPKTPAPLGMVCSSQLALRAAALSFAWPRFISVILLNRAVSDYCVGLEDG
jgi:hypothetical protein